MTKQSKLPFTRFAARCAAAAGFAALFPFVSVSGESADILVDTFSFDAASPGDTDSINSGLDYPGRQEGAAAPSEWLLNRDWRLIYDPGWSDRADFFFQKTPDMLGGRGSPNFPLQSHVSGDGYEIEVDVIFEEEADPRHWAALSIGGTPAAPTSSDTHGFFVRPATGWAVFQKDTVVHSTGWGGDGSFQSLDEEKPTFTFRVRVEDGEAGFFVNDHRLSWDDGENSVDVTETDNDWVTLFLSQSGNADPVEARFANFEIRDLEPDETEPEPEFPALVFDDHFTFDAAFDGAVAGVNDHSGFSGRQAGPASPADWLLNREWELIHETDWSGKAEFFMRKPHSEPSGRGSPQIDFRDYVEGGAYEIEVDVIFEADADPRHWAALSIGGTPAAPTSSDTHGFFVRPATGWAVYQQNEALHSTGWGGDGSFQSLDAEKPAFAFRVRVEDGEAGFFVNDHRLSWDDGVDTVDVTATENQWVTLFVSQSGNAEAVEVRFANFTIRTQSADAPSFASWQAEHFDEEQWDDPAVGTAGADPSGRGIPNLLSYVLDQDPWNPDRQALPVLDLDGERPALRFTRIGDLTDVAFMLEGSTDLSQWDPVSTEMEVLDQTENLETIRWMDDDESEPERRFLRLRLERL